jgi:hypothetical protein
MQRLCPVLQGYKREAVCLAMRAIRSLRRVHQGDERSEQAAARLADRLWEICDGIFRNVQPRHEDQNRLELDHYFGSVPLMLTIEATSLKSIGAL